MNIRRFYLAAIFLLSLALFYQYSVERDALAVGEQLQLAEKAKAKRAELESGSSIFRKRPSHPYC